MTGSDRSLAVALLTPPPDAPVARGLAADLRALGDRPRLIAGHGGRPGRVLEAALRLRSIEPGIAHLPSAYASLARGRDDVGHAFGAVEAAAALHWRRRAGRPVVFSCMGQLTRDVIASDRLRKRTLERAMSEADAVTAPSEAAAEAAWRWFGVRPLVIEAPSGAQAFHDLYRELAGR